MEPFYRYYRYQEFKISEDQKKKKRIWKKFNRNFYFILIFFIYHFFNKVEIRRNRKFPNFNPNIFKERTERKEILVKFQFQLIP